MQSENRNRESGDDRRLAIARAARAIIVERGLEGLRTRDIAARVGINIATLHYHVPTKEALVRLVAESLRDEFREQGLRRPRADLSGLAQLRLEMEDVLETLAEAPDRLQIMSELVERSRRDPAVAAIIEPMTGHWRSALEAIFERGISDGTLRADIDPAGAALVFIGAVSGLRLSHSPRDAAVAVLNEIERAFATPATERN
ncbi:MAG: TetR/AcrR family transcriptional regulator [Devosia sp.]|uniref:TetR/AcrR family transcriptional regulator n=1 Tax=Devosia sp. TaxID=1871048 RepID=UPI0024C797DC|nr:TetR/AcrR family transcriptional regulator [Devosia sp.]UYN98158.1 MAG: TetR/AcrR family transcriptional regulator [Devosia sp.]